MDYIIERDGGGECDASDIILCAGASEGIRAVMKLIFNPEGAPEGQKPGVMIPIPQVSIIFVKVTFP